MQTIYTEHGRTTVALTTLAGVCAVALLGAILAYWTWAWLSPAPEARAATPTQAADASVPTPAAYALFGNAQRSSAGAAPPAGALRLLGVVAASGDLAAYAVIQTQSRRSIAIRAGDEISPGLRLAEVRTDRVILSRGVEKVTLILPQPGRAAGTTTPALAK